MNYQIIDTYIDQNETSYQAKYCYHSCDWLGEGKYKFHYYIRDPQLIQIDIFLNITIHDVIEVDVLEELHEQEKNAIAIDALKRIRRYCNRKITLGYKDVPLFIENPVYTTNLTSQDIVHIWNYIWYHEGINHDSVYHFYTIYLNFIEETLTHKNYFLVMESINFLLDEILYKEVTWRGINGNYLDQKYMMHQAYIRAFFNSIEEEIEHIYREVEMLFIILILKLLKYPRLGFAVYPVVESLIVNHHDIFEEIFGHLTRLFSEHKAKPLSKMIFQLMSAKYYNDLETYHETVISLLLQLVNEMVSTVNHEEQIQVGWMFIQKEGYQVVLDAFNQSCNSYIFQYFSINEIPVEYHGDIKSGLEKAVQYYAKILEKEPRNLTAFDQIVNCNTLLIENFK